MFRLEKPTVVAFKEYFLSIWLKKVVNICIPLAQNSLVPDYLYVYVVAGVFLSIVVVTFMVVYLQRIYIKTNKFFRSVKNCIPNVLVSLPINFTRIKCKFYYAGY